MFTGIVTALGTVSAITPLGGGADMRLVIAAPWPDTDAIILTGFPNVSSAVEAMRLGAADYFSKPFEVGTITHRLKVVLERRLVYLPLTLADTLDTVVRATYESLAKRLFAPGILVE